MKILIALLISLPLCAQTTVYLRTPTAGGSFAITACTQATPVMCTTTSPHGFSNNQVVAVYNVWGVWAANGLRKALTGTNCSPTCSSSQFQLTDINGVNVNGVTGSSAFCSPYTGSGVCSAFAGQQSPSWGAFAHGISSTVSALGTFTLKGHPRVLLDGPSGTLTASIANTASTGKANANNLPWQAIQNYVSTLEAGNAYLTIFNQLGSNDNAGQQSQNIGQFAEAALEWNALAGSTDLTVSKWAIDNIQQMLGGSFGCNTATTVAGSPNPGYCFSVERVFPTAFYMYDLAQLYSLIRSQLTSTEKTNFANAVLNGQTPATDGWDPSGCTNQFTGVGTGTISTSGASTTITLSGGTTSQLTVGDYILVYDSTQDYQSNTVIPITGITDSTHFTTSTPITISSAVGFDIYTAWTSSSCGLIWFLLHHIYSPFVDPYNYLNNTGTNFFAEANITLNRIQAIIALSLSLADDDPRAVDLLAMSYAYYYDNQFGPIEKNMWTGIEQSRLDYGTGVEEMVAQIAAEITNSVNSYDQNLLGGLYLQRGNALQYYLTMPPSSAINCSSPCITFWGDPGQSQVTPDQLGQAALTIGLYPTTTEAKYLNWWVRNQSGMWSASTNAGINYAGGWRAPEIFIFMDPTFTATDLASAPHQYLFNDTDQASCSSYGFTCPSYKQYSEVVSRTGLKSGSDTFASFFTSDWYTSDHTDWGESGELQIVKNVFLLGGDSQSNQNANGPSEGTTNTPEFGGANSTLRNPGVDYFDTTILRWAGADPTGDPNNNYSYALAELVCNYRVPAGTGTSTCPSPNSAGQPMTRAQRHFLHVKPSGFNDYIYQYDDWAASSGTTMRTYLHYALNYTANCSTVTSPGEGVTFSGGSSGGSVTSSQFSSAQLLSQIIAPAGANTLYTYSDNANGTYTGGQGCTFRVSMCAGNGSCSGSATSFEALVVHRPTTNLSETLATTAQLTASNFRVVQVNDPAHAQVAAFAMGGNTYNAVSFTTSFSGTASHVIAGLTAGTYTITAPSASPSTCIVATGDSTCYFEAGPGSVSLSLGGALGGSVISGNIKISGSPIVK